MLSFRSQVKLIPVSWSNIASDGKLGNRQPDSLNQKTKRKVLKVNKNGFQVSDTMNVNGKFNSHLGFQLYESNPQCITKQQKDKQNLLKIYTERKIDVESVK